MISLSELECSWPTPLLRAQRRRDAHAARVAEHRNWKQAVLEFPKELGAPTAAPYAVVDGGKRMVDGGKRV